jgi:hypothetical protein
MGLGSLEPTESLFSKSVRVFCNAAALLGFVVHPLIALTMRLICIKDIVSQKTHAALAEGAHPGSEWDKLVDDVQTTLVELGSLRRRTSATVNAALSSTSARARIG